MTLGIIGGTGSGKSSFAAHPTTLDRNRLCERLWSQRQKLYSDQLRALITHVPQHTSLVSSTIRTNSVLENPNASDEELWSVLEVATADFVREKPDQLIALSNVQELRGQSAL